MTTDPSDDGPAEQTGDGSRAAVTPFGRALPRVLVLGAFVLLAALAYLLDARTHLRPLAAVTFASAAVMVVALTELGVFYVGRLGSAPRARPQRK